MTDVRLKLAPPWITYVNEVMALFGNDPDITVKYDNDTHRLNLYVNNHEKSAALSRLMPFMKTFGNINLMVYIIPCNYNDDLNLDEAEDLMSNIEEKYEFNTIKDIFDSAFDRNPVYAFSRSIDSIFSNTITYVVFKNRVVQFFNDNLNDIYGNISTLYQEIASDVFYMDEYHGLEGVFYCTDVEEKVGKPLGEWP